MNSISEIFQEPGWKITIEFDENVGGDGERVRILGDTNSFRKLSEILTTMAATVEHSDHPASETGWHLGLNPADLPQLEIKNARLLSLVCSPANAD